MKYPQQADKRLRLLAIGEAMAEISCDESRQFQIGFAGDTFNTAVYCTRSLGVAGAVAFQSRIGADPLSERFLELARLETLNTDHIEIDGERQIGIYTVATDGNGERSFAYWRSRSAARLLFDDDTTNAPLPNAEIIYLSAITLAIMAPKARNRLINQLKARSADGETLIAFDSNYRPRLWESQETAKEIISRMWSLADIAFPSIDDEMALYDETAETVIERFCRKEWTACAVKRGQEGPHAPTLAANQMPEFKPADRVVDTTAAGDSFNGGYLAAYLQRRSEAECLKAGHDLASTVIGFQGAIIPG